MEDHYFIIHSGEDGITIHGPLDADEVRDRITVPKGDTTNYYGTTGFHAEVPGQDKGHFWSQVWSSDNQPHKKLLIIKGEVIVPQPVAKVVEYKL